MPQHINIATREDVPRTYSRERAAHEDYTEETGWRETIPYTGTWAAMLTLADSAVSGDRDAYQVTADVTRMEGGMAEARITYVCYRKPTDEESGDGEGGGTGDSELGTENNPTYTSTTSMVQEPLLAHPLFEDIQEGSIELRALKALLDGQDERSLIDTAQGPVRVIDCITSQKGRLALKKIRRGVYYVLQPSTQVTARWSGINNRYAFGDIVTTAPGFPGTPRGCNYLCVGLSKEKNGKNKSTSATFLLSGKGGWDTDLYGNSN